MEFCTLSLSLAGRSRLGDLDVDRKIIVDDLRIDRNATGCNGGSR
jgi:hypothetical protein